MYEIIIKIYIVWRKEKNIATKLEEIEAVGTRRKPPKFLYGNQKREWRLPFKKYNEGSKK